MSSSWWMLIRSRLPDPVGGFIFIPVRKVHQKISLAAVMQRKTTRFRVCTNDRKRFIIKEKRLWNSSTLLSKPAVKKHCTAKLQKQLKDNYEYDGEGYAIWNFRTGMQDGPSDISKVTSVTALGNGLYKVNFIDMGIKGNRTLKIIDVNGTLKFDAIK